jgi:hypothetical protein
MRRPYRGVSAASEIPFLAISTHSRILATKEIAPMLIDVTDSLAAVSLALELAFNDAPPVRLDLFKASDWVLSTTDQRQLSALPGRIFKVANPESLEAPELERWTVISTATPSADVAWSGDTPLIPTGYVTSAIARELSIVAAKFTLLPPSR